MLRINKQFYKFSSTLANDLTRLVHPIEEQCYFQTQIYGQSIELNEKDYIINLAQEFLSSTTQYKHQIQSITQRIKQIEPKSFDIVSDQGVEWGLRERFLQVLDAMPAQNLELRIQAGFSQQDQIIQKGYMEVYGVSPYRHLNDYMSDYTYRIELPCIYFEKKNYQFKEVSDKQKKHNESGKMEEAVTEGIKKDQNILEKTKNAFYKFNKLFIKQENFKPKPNMIEKIISSLDYKNTVQTKQQHILVRDYQILTDMKLEVFQEGKPIIENQVKQPVYIRTETLYDPKESESTRKLKKQVLVDFNWLMRGNPWVWVKRFDLQK